MRKRRNDRLRRKEILPLSKETILHLMEKEDRPLLLREIQRHLGLEKAERQRLKEIFKELIGERKILRIRGNRFGLPRRMSLVIGRIKCHPDGYGFVIPDAEGEEDVFVNSRNLKEAMHGDRVVARVESISKRGREGRIIRIIERGRSKIVGKFMKSKSYAYVIPEDERILQEISIPEDEAKRARPGQIVVAEIKRYPSKKIRPEGRVVHIIGYPEDPEIEPEIIIYKYDLPHRFSLSALTEARNLPRSISREEYLDRVDLRGIPTFTIDGQNARDFDDAVSIERNEEGLKLYVSISDVSYYIKEGTALDEEALERGTSIYFPDRAISMFPPEVSNEICCLHPLRDRLCISAELKFDMDGNLKGVRFYPSVIQSVERLTYTIVKKIIMDGDLELRDRLGHVVPSLELMAYLSERLRMKRIQRGALDFDLPEPEVIFNLQGGTEDIIRAERNIAHQIIEEFMIAANEAVARFMEEKGMPFIYRIHEPPDEKAMDEFRRFIYRLGYRLGDDRIDSPDELQRILSEAKGKPEEKLINNILLRSMKWAKYSSQNRGHFGLASKSYTHFTSPIRRYPDLIVHRLLKRVLLGKEVILDDLEKKAEYLSRRERVAMEAEREILERYRVRFMKEKVGDEFDGVISGVSAFGFFVELREIFVEGLVMITALPDDYYRYDEDRYAIIGERSHRTFKIGDEVRVRVDRVDLERRQIDFRLIRKVDKNSRQ